MPASKIRPRISAPSRSKGCQAATDPKSPRSRTKKSRPKILLFYPFFDDLIEEHLRPFADVAIIQPGKKGDLQLASAEGIVSLVSTPVDGAFLDRAPNLRVIGNFGVGVNNIQFSECKKRGIAVCNTPDVLTQATAELTLCLLLAVARRLPEGESLCRKDQFKGIFPDFQLGLQLSGRHAVLVGEGRIGSRAAELMRSFGMSTEFITRHDSPAVTAQKLGRAQVLSLHFPLTPDTRHWLDSKRLARLPKDAIVINTSRGPTVDEGALIRCLQKKQIWGAGLDVFEHEPRIPLQLRKLKNVVLTPHIGSGTLETRRAMARLIFEGVLAVLHGKRPKNQLEF